ncbi:uncharacterized protein OCT59_003007 [Rhizophagus irregularis]|uniref:uncharacterized protein n=1 Tax=Rhizophagus irregularis TaxID=588596 RepID=UPI003316C316|nr:hypothetical protein OCT59_003007 [Rhizophagus irregularis]
MSSENYENRIRDTSRFNANNANNANNIVNRSRPRLINNTKTLDQIARIVPQPSDNYFVHTFFNGTDFNGANDFEHILPASFPSSSSFPY